MGCCSFFLSFPQLSTILSAAPNLLFFFYRRVLIAMSFTTNPLPSFGSTLPAARNTMVARDLSLPFRRDVDTPWQAFSPPLNFRVLSWLINVSSGLSSLSTESTEYSRSSYFLLCQRRVNHVQWGRCRDSKLFKRQGNSTSTILWPKNCGTPLIYLLDFL